MAKGKRLTTKQFIQKAKARHGNRYDYSKVVYKGAKEKVLIICPIHGEFLQISNKHLRGSRCPACANRIRFTTQEQSQEHFIKKAKEMHGDKFDYSKVKYIDSKTHVTVVCPIHGDFKIKPNVHLITNNRRRIGCPECKKEKRRKENYNNFIQQSIEKHGDKYDYSKVEYISVKKKITIVCPIHGDFWLRPDCHVGRGDGCPTCGNGPKSRKLDLKRFIKKSKKIHGDKYDYSKVNKTINARSEIKIICPDHGEFTQKVHSHVYLGHGCSKCSNNQVSEPLFREVLEKIFVDKFNKEYKFPNTRPEWLRNPETKYPLELDCYNKELELAFELHGTQHYEPIEYFGGEKSYIKQYRRDLRTRNACWEKGVTLFAIDNRPARNKAISTRQQYYEQEILKCLAKVPKKIKVKLLENKVPVQRQSETTIYNT